MLDAILRSESLIAAIGIGMVIIAVVVSMYIPPFCRRCGVRTKVTDSRYDPQQGTRYRVYTCPQCGEIHSRSVFFK